MTPDLLNALAQTALATGFTFLCTAAGAAAVFFMKPGSVRGRGAELAETLSLGFAAGIMIAASVWSLIIPVQEMAKAQGGTPWLAAGAGVAAGALFLKLLDTALPHLHPGAARPEGPKTSMHRALLLFIAITLHNVPEGGSVGLVAGSAAFSGEPAALFSALALALGVGIADEQLTAQLLFKLVHRPAHALGRDEIQLRRPGDGFGFRHVQEVVQVFDVHS